MEKTALLSDCGRYRFRLGRRWGPGQALGFVMLNPSVADGEVDDPTIRRCVGFASASGFEAIEVVNLFAYRATDPQHLKDAGFPVGQDNDAHIAETARTAARLCVAWGATARGLTRPAHVLELLRDSGVQPYCLGVTNGGEPRHPLMVRSTVAMLPLAQALQERQSLSALARGRSA